MDPVSKAQSSQNRGKVTEKSLKNLKPFKKGQSGNPGGKPRKKPITEIYEKILRSGKNRKEIEAALLKVLLGGRMSTVLLAREMAERVEGKVAQEIEVDLSGEIHYSEAVARIRARKAKIESD